MLFRSLSVVGDAHPVSPVIGLSAYRIAQEALTNVRKHAGAAATAEVRVRWSDAAVEVEVTNTGAARGPRLAVAGSEADRSSDAGGLGQVGMRERVAAAGGTLELGPRARGGYLVRAGFPLRRGEEGHA